MPKALRGVLIAILIAIVIVVLFTTVFPWVESLQQDPTLGSPADRVQVLVQLARSPR